jgi:hypothetical protein
MNYSFFLFSKLYDVYHVDESPYDILFYKLSAMYKNWMIWDIDNGKGIGEYESMSNYLSNHN